jgi:hypothetical protein
MNDFSDARPHERGLAFGEILSAAGIHKDSVVRVTGPAGLAALLWFSRHGFNQVGYARPVDRPTVDGDLLLVPQTCGVEALDAILSHGPKVRPGGVLIVQTPEPPPDTRTDPVHDLLVQRGYIIELCLHGRHRELHVARRRASPLAFAA